MNTLTHRIAVLNKAALDSACLLDWLKNTSGVSDDDREQAGLIVERIYRAAEALGVEIGGLDETPRIDLYIAKQPQEEHA